MIRYLIKSSMTLRALCCIIFKESSICDLLYSHTFLIKKNKKNKKGVKIYLISKNTLILTFVHTSYFLLQCFIYLYMKVNSKLICITLRKWVFWGNYHVYKLYVYHNVRSIKMRYDLTHGNKPSQRILLILARVKDTIWLHSAWHMRCQISDRCSKVHYYLASASTVNIAMVLDGYSLSVKDRQTFSAWNSIQNVSWMPCDTCNLTNMQHGKGNRKFQKCVRKTKELLISCCARVR